MSMDNEKIELEALFPATGYPPPPETAYPAGTELILRETFRPFCVAGLAKISELFSDQIRIERYIPDARPNEGSYVYSVEDNDGKRFHGNFGERWGGLYTPAPQA